MSATNTDSQPSALIQARAVIAFAAFVMLIPAVVFLAAGTLLWPLDWVYYGLTVGAGESRDSCAGPLRLAG